MSEINAVILRADGNAEIAYIDNGLDAAQKIVGGYIQAVTPHADTGFGAWLAWVNEDGKPMGLPRNHVADELLTRFGWQGVQAGDFIVGDIVIVGDSDDGDTVDVPDEALQATLAFFREHGAVET